MSVLDWQADEAVPDDWLRVVGAMRTYAQRMQFFLGVPNTLMIAVLFYNDATALHAIFPTVYHWVAFILLGVVPAAILVDRVILHPAQIIYNQYQNGRENRSPNFHETMENQRKLEAIQERLDEMEES